MKDSFGITSEGIKVELYTLTNYRFSRKQRSNEITRHTQMNEMKASRMPLATSSIHASIFFSALLKKLLHLIVLGGSCCFISLSSESYARDAPIKVEQLLQTTRSWEGTRYTGYLGGQPQITILKITVPRNTALDWHQHPMINAGYVLSGQIILEKRDTRERKAFHAGQALAECVNATHRGYTTDQPAELIVFYAGAQGVPLSIKTK